VPWLGWRSCQPVGLRRRLTREHAVADHGRCQGEVEGQVGPNWLPLIPSFRLSTRVNAEDSPDRPPFPIEGKENRIHHPCGYRRMVESLLPPQTPWASTCGRPISSHAGSCPVPCGVSDSRFVRVRPHLRPISYVIRALTVERKKTDFCCVPGAEPPPPTGLKRMRKRSHERDRSGSAP
jgi:hypothetical protein